MDEAFVENAEHDVDRDERRDDEQALHARLLDERLGVAGGLAADGVRHVQVGERRVDVPQAGVDLTPGFRL